MRPRNIGGVERCGYSADLFQSRADSLGDHPALRGILTRELLGAPAKLLLQPDIPRPLHRSHEPREILLLLLDYCDALLLQLERLVDQRVHVILIRRRRGHLHAQCLTCLAFLHRNPIELGREAGVRLVELRHLRVAEPNALLGQLRYTLAKLLLERGPIAIGRRANRLGESAGSAERQGHRRQSNGSLHPLNHGQRLSPLSTAMTGSGSAAGRASN